MEREPATGEVSSPALAILGVFVVGFIAGALVGYLIPGRSDKARLGPPHSQAAIGKSAFSGSPPSSPGLLDTPGGRESARLRLVPEDALLALSRRIEDANTGLGFNREMLEIAHLTFQLREDQLPSALNLLRNHPQALLKSILVSALFSRWAEIDPTVAVEQAQRESDPALKMQALQGAMSSWAETDARAAWNWVTREDGGPQNLQLLSSVLSGIATRDPRLALDFAEEMDNPVLRNQAMTTISFLWSNQDPEGALAWAATIEDESLRDQTIPNVLSSIARSNPDRALELTLQQEDKKLRDHALSSIISQMAHLDPDQAFEFLGRVPPELLPDRVSSGLGYALIAVSPEKIDLYAENIPQGRERASFYKSIIQAKAGQGGIEEAIDLLERIPAGDDRLDTVQSLTGAWGHRNPTAASEWLDQLPAGPERDRAIQGFAWSVLEADPDASLIWAASIGDETSRNSQLRNLANRWLKKDSAAATSWIQDSTQLSQDLKKQLLKPAP
jgi:hypothetical protein